MLKPGDKVPDFKLQNQDGKTKTLKDYAGKWLVLYVYPKDDTPGCTIQGKSFTTQKAAFDAMGVNIVGLSADDVTSHKNFSDKFKFTIDLLADPEASLLNQMGVGQSDYKGTKYWDRTTLIADSQGVIRQVYEKVSPEGHESMLLKELKSLQSTSH